MLDIANKYNAEINEHKEFVGGRYSVLSEVGMLPALLMGLNIDKFKNFTKLIKNKKFISCLVHDVACIYTLNNKSIINSIFLSYDSKLQDLCYWYQQLVGESLAKNGEGITPILSPAPRDHHSMMQLYLDGPQKNFYTFFSVHEKNKNIINNKRLLQSHYFLKNKYLENILYFQKKATESVFKKKNIPFRSFEILNRNEKSLGEIFCFFILETILLGRALKVNPFDQPSVELIKKETKKILLKN